MHLSTFSKLLLDVDDKDSSRTFIIGYNLHAEEIRVPASETLKMVYASLMSDSTSYTEEFIGVKVRVH